MLDTKIVNKDGLLYIDAGGELLSPVAYMTYCPDKKYFDEFKAAGYKIFSFPVYLCDWGINTESGLKQFMPHVYIGENEYNFKVVADILEKVVSEGEKIYFFPRVYLQTPSWWDAENPDELSTDFCGERIRTDFISDKARQTLWNALKCLIDFIENSKWKDNVIGYQVAGGGTEEWTYQATCGEQFYNYSQNNRKCFSKFLKEKYKNIDIINKTWQKNYTDFSEIEIPVPAILAYTKNGVLRDIASEAAAIDFYEYHSTAVADTILYYAEKIKKYTHNKALVGAFYGYIWMFHRAYKGHYALHKLLENKNIDFLASTNGWTDPGCGFPFGSTAHSALLHGKLFMCEGDIRTHLTREMGSTMPQAVPDGNDYYSGAMWSTVQNEFEAASALKKAMGRTLTERVGIWWFDMFSGWFSSAKLMDLLAKYKTCMDAREISPMHSEIALILDESSVYYHGLELGRKSYFTDRTSIYNKAVNDVQKVELEQIGAPYDIYEAKDLAYSEFDANQYKLYIFLDMIHPSETIKEAINTKIKGNGRTLVWFYFEDAYRHSEVTGFKTTYNKFDLPMSASFLDKEFPFVKVSCPRFVDCNTDDYYTLRIPPNHASCIKKNRIGRLFTHCFHLFPQNCSVKCA